MFRINLIVPILLTALLGLLAQGPDYTWLGQNDRGNRYEGSYTRKVANPAIELISFTWQYEAFEIGKNQILKIRFYLPDSARYFLKAEELRPVQYYWMQDKTTLGRQGWNLFNNWPVDTWLKRLNISSDNLGIVVRAGDKKSNQIAPAFVYHAVARGKTARYVARFRLGHSVSKGEAVLYKGLYEIRMPPGNQKIHTFTLQKKSGGSYFPVVIPTAYLGDQAGWFTISLELSKEGSIQKILFTFSFYHQPES